MKVIPTEIEGVVLLEPEVFGDARGYFFESYSEQNDGVLQSKIFLILILSSCGLNGLTISTISGRSARCH